MVGKGKLSLIVKAFKALPRVTFCGYSIPHPSENRVNVRVQTTGDPACEVLKDGCQDLMLMCQHVRSTFEKAVNDFKTSKTGDHMDIV
ncbi:DNA-directed RNA polymerases I, II, and III subunit RPABC1 [Trifolium pratense]|uniref:DNA-directed RNA polymerases I, II, and III subunit RPABC1 n=1 Tax=Trifolium pratense TaxID=57577 RepID=A0A2K3NYU2_TRIPR|nr:DNA-directed RNA polymerases I, II, and III subunit RPABC1 [Trifolium pratense]